jgi:hypothetical protein
MFSEGAGRNCRAYAWFDLNHQCDRGSRHRHEPYRDPRRIRVTIVHDSAGEHPRVDHLTNQTSLRVAVPG